jgi:hypothetical protein
MCKRWAIEEREMTPTERTKRVLEVTMDGLDSSLTFKMETGEDFDDGWLPMLKCIRQKPNNIQILWKTDEQ